MKEQDVWRHWTRRGSFRIERGFAAGSETFTLFLNDRCIGPYLNPFSAAIALSYGELDEEIGFDTEDLEIPWNIHEWNGFK